MKNFMVTYSINGTIILEAKNEDEARKNVEKMSNEEILDYAKCAINGDGLEIGSIDTEE